MGPMDRLGPVQISQRAGNPDHPVETARREAECAGCPPQQIGADLVKGGDPFQHRRRCLCVGVDLPQVQSGITRGLPVSRRDNTGERFGRPLARGRTNRSSSGTAGTSMIRSNRSSSGPERRPA